MKSRELACTVGTSGWAVTYLAVLGCLVSAAHAQCTRCRFPGINLSPVSLTFGPQVVNPAGGASAVQTITVTSTGKVALIINSLSASADYSQTNNCPIGHPMPTGSNCAIQVTFTPNALGTINGVVTVSGNASAVAGLSGTGIAPVGFSLESLDFGAAATNTTSAAQTVTLTNNQSTSLAISGVSASGDYSQTHDCPPALGAGQQCSIKVIFHPTVSGTLTGALTVTADALPGTQPVGLTGIGSGSVASHVAFSPYSLSFGNQEAGTASVPQSITLTNTSSTHSLGISIVAASSSGYAETSTCAGKTLAPGGECTIQVTFQPLANFAIVSYPGAITVVDSDSTSPHVAGLSGTGVAPVSTSPAGVEFGTSYNGKPLPAPQTVTLTNNDGVAETVSVSVVGGSYNISNNNCTSLAPGGSCSLQVASGNSSFGNSTGALNIIPSGGGFLTPEVVNISSCAADLGLAPTSLNFGSQAVGITSPTETVTLFNFGPRMNISGVSLTGLNASDFTISNNACGSGLAYQTSCRLDLTFTPAASGTRSGTLSIADDHVCSPHQVTLTGGSSAGPFVVTAATNGGTSSGSGTVVSNPAGLNCGSIGGPCSASFSSGASVVLSANPDLGSRFTGWGGACTGTGTCTLDMTADKQVAAVFTANPQLTVSMAGAGAGSVTSNPAGIDCLTSNCAASFAPGTSVSLTANPASGSAFVGWSGVCSGTGACRVTMNADQSVTATFNSTAAPDFSLTPTLASLTMQPGGQGTDTITVAPQNGAFGSAIQLSCAVAGPAPMPTCMLSPPSVTPGANSAISTLTIAAPASAMLTPSIHWRHKWFYGLWLPLVMVGIIPVVATKQQRRRQWAVYGLLLLVLLLQIACGGGGGTPPGPKSYTVTVTGGTSDGIQHTTKVTVMVR